MGLAGANAVVKSNAAMRGGRSFMHPVEYTWEAEATAGIGQTATHAVSERLHLEFQEAVRRDRIRARIGLAAGAIAALILLAYGWWG